MESSGAPSAVPLQKRTLTPEELAGQEENRKRRVQEYLRLLKSEYLHFRWNAAEALGDEGDPAAIEPLIAALKDPYVDVGWLAAKSLGKIGDPRAIEPLLALLTQMKNGSVLVQRGGLENSGMPGLSDR